MEGNVNIEDLKSGDVVLFSGKGFISRLIQLATWSPYSHVGLVLKDKRGTLLWESTTLSTLPDINTGELTKGVQLVCLKDRIDIYDGKVAVRQLKTPLSAEQEAAYRLFRDEVRGRAYEKSKVALARSAIDLISGQSEDLSTLFCSEMNAEAYQRMKLIDESKSSAEYTPADFARSMNDILGSLIKLN